MVLKPALNDFYARADLQCREYDIFLIIAYITFKKTPMSRFLLKGAF